MGLCDVCDVCVCGVCDVCVCGVGVMWVGVGVSMPPNRVQLCKCCDRWCVQCQSIAITKCQVSYIYSLVFPPTK